MFWRRLGSRMHVRRTLRETGMLLTDFVVGIALFSVILSMIASSVGLLITLVGFPLLALTVQMGRLISTLECARIGFFLQTEIPPVGAQITHPDQSVLERLKRYITDPAGWRGIGYGITLAFWGTITFVVIVSFWSVAIAGLMAPLLGWVFPVDTSDVPSVLTDGSRENIAVVGSFVLGVVALFMVPRVTHLLATGTERLARALLTPDDRAALIARSERSEKQKGALEESTTLALRQIERDLHDGAQQRLVAVAMNLGIATARLEEQGDADVRELVTGAHDEAKKAIVELRDLARGIRPAVLEELGLDAALTGLGSRCPIPVHLLLSTGNERFSSSIENTIYFVVAESLTNATKHSAATAVQVRLWKEGEVLLVEVADDGQGGADEQRGSGLRSLRERVFAVGGQFSVNTNVDIGTVVKAEVPCG